MRGCWTTLEYDIERSEDMTREEIVTALRCVAVCGGYFSAAADLVESQQREIEALRQANEGLRFNLAALSTPKGEG